MRATLLALLLLPTLTFAASVPAGFPTSSLWLSKTTPTEGDSVTIYTVVYNASDAALIGNVSFLIGTSTLGTKEVKVPSGSSEIVSYPWTAVPGSHTFSAKLGGVAEGVSTASAVATISVIPKPPPPPAPAAVSQTIESASAITDAIASSSPVVAKIASTTIATAESVRASALGALEKLASSTTPKGEVLGASDEQKTPEENVSKTFDIGATIQNIWVAILGALLYIFRSPLLFYVFVAIVLFILLSFAKTLIAERRE